MLKAPWTPEQVAALNRWQNAGTVHPFTCPGEACETGRDPSRTLIATEQGWVCQCGAYRQGWAHPAMLGPPPPSPFAVLNRKDERRD